MSDDGQPRIVIDTAPPTRSPQPVYGKPPPVSRRRGRIIVGAIGVVAVLAAGAFAVVTLTKSDDVGASTPEGAVAQLVSAVEDRDLLGVLDSIAPAERDVWAQPMLDLVSTAQRLEALALQADATAVAGLNLQLKTVEDDLDEVADGIVVVPVDGTASVAVDWSMLPLGTLLVSNGVPSNGAANGRFAFDVRVATVEFDDRWYVSIENTVAEAARVALDDDLEWPEQDAGVQPVGSRRPEDAALAFLEAVSSLSLQDVIARLDPDEAAVLQRVAPWFLDRAQKAIDALVARTGLAVDDLTVAPRLVEPAPERGRIALDDLTFTVSAGATKVRVAAGCTTTSPPAALPIPVCWHSPMTLDGPAGTPFGSMGFDEIVAPIDQLATDLQASLTDLGETGLVVHLVRDQWYVSPVASLWQYLFGLLTSLDAGESARLYDDVSLLGSAFVRMVSPPEPVEPAVIPEETVTQDPVDAYNTCQGKRSYERALECVQDGLLAAKFPRDLVDGIYLVPECGWFGTRFDPALPLVADADYVMRAAIAAACFDEKIASGVITASQRPFELLKVHCLNGKNPSHMTPTEAQRYSDCRLGP